MTAAPNRASSDPTLTPRAALFDMDGVLVDSFDVWLRVMNEAANRLGADPITADQIRQTWGKGIEADREVYYPASTLQEVESEFSRAFPDALSELIVMDGARELFAGLKRAGIPVAVVTNTPRDIALTVLEFAGLSPEVLVGSTDVERSKPAPDMMLRACREVGVDPSESIVVGDSVYDAQAARAAGCGFIGFRLDAEAERVERHAELLERWSVDGLAS